MSTRRGFSACAVAAGLLVACAAPPAPSRAPFGLEAAATGVVAGTAWSWDGAGFEALPGAVARLGERSFVAGPDGAFRFDAVPAGAWRLAAAAAGHRTAEIAGTMPGGLAVPDVPAVLVGDLAVAALAAGDRAIVGSLVDPRGTGVPGGTVHCVDAVSGDGLGGNQRWTTDARGRFVGLLRGAAGREGEARLMGYGVTADGRRVETRTVRAIALGADRIAVAALTTDVEVPADRADRDIYPILNVASVTFVRFRVQ